MVNFRTAEVTHSTMMHSQIPVELTSRTVFLHIGVPFNFQHPKTFNVIDAFSNEITFSRWVVLSGHLETWI